MDALTLNEVIGWHRSAMAKQEHWRALKTWAWIMAHDPRLGTMLALDMSKQDIQHECLAWIVKHPEEAAQTSGLCKMYGQLGVGKGHGPLGDYRFRLALPTREDIELEQAFEALEVVCTQDVAWHTLEALSSTWSKTEHGFTQGAQTTLRWSNLASHQRREIVERGLDAWLASKSLKVT